MWTATTVNEVRRLRSEYCGLQVGFVPTMGALHPGHMKLVELAKRHAQRVIVSIFVNPTQFAPHEDLARYPRPIERDLDLCRTAGVDGVFNPSVDEIYPPGMPECVVEVPAVAAGLETDFRPRFFRGVCRVVNKLFNIIQPELSVFGEKDYQQLQVVRAMVADTLQPIRIIGCPTQRESDGLAMSSRNVYLDKSARSTAVTIYQTLLGARSQLAKGSSDPLLAALPAMESSMRDALTRAGFSVDYAVLRHADTLAIPDPARPVTSPAELVALIAARLGPARLIDNMKMG